MDYIDPDKSGEVGYDEFIDEFGGGGGGKSRVVESTGMAMWD